MGVDYENTSGAGLRQTQQIFHANDTDTDQYNHLSHLHRGGEKPVRIMRFDNATQE